jgi:transposase
MKKEEQRFIAKVFWLKGWGSKKIYLELMSTRGDDAYGLSQIKIWLQRFRTGDLSCSDSPRAGRPPLTLGPQVEAFLQKYPFASVHIIAKHFLTTASTLKNSSEKIGDEEILPALGPSFFERYSNNRAC